MALWQIIDTYGGKLEEQFDDGKCHKPGEPEFSTYSIDNYAGPGNYNYIGTPNWKPEKDNDE